MNLVEQHRISKNHPFYKECNDLSFKTKNLYNQALYRIKTHFNISGEYLSYGTLNNELLSEKQNDYVLLPSKIAQQTLRQLDTNFKNYFKALKVYEKYPNKFKNKPNPPNFLDKIQGRFLVIFNSQSILRRKQKIGILGLSKTNISIKTNKIAKQITISPLRTGEYSINILYEKDCEAQVKSEIFAGIDIGVNNIATVALNTGKSFIANGKPLKSINQYYNKKLAKLKSKLPHYIDSKGKKKQRSNSNAIKKLTNKRNNKVKDYLHKASSKVVNELKQHNVSRVIIGHNNSWKDNVSIGKKNNQNFVLIPHTQFIQMLNYKLELVGISSVIREESYTSKCSFLDNEPICKHEEYMGKRLKRGIFKANNGMLINADQNGALNILKKEIPNCFTNGIEGFVVSPRKLSF